MSNQECIEDAKRMGGRTEFGEGVGDVDAISASCEVPCSIGAGCGLACGSHERLGAPEKTRAHPDQVTGHALTKPVGFFS